jgi:hypothetical protein
MTPRGGPRPGLFAALAVGLLAVVLLSACGANSLSDGQLRSRTNRICRLAQKRAGRIATPTTPADGARFLNRGIAVLAPELRALQKLRPSSGLRDDYRDALSAAGRELAALRSAVKGLKAGNDPVVAIKTLQQQLMPLEADSARAWTALELPACQGR